MSKLGFHLRKDSEELEVFQATKYFSGSTDVASNVPHRCFGASNERPSQEPLTATKTRTRMSMDFPASGRHHGVSFLKETIIEQPNTPRGRLRSFLNSFGKKKLKVVSAEIREGVRRMRRFSISDYSGARTDPDRSSGPLGHRYNQVASLQNLPVGDNGERQYGRNVYPLCNKQNKTKEYEVFEADGDGGDTDSSSDLFELETVKSLSYNYA